MASKDEARRAGTFEGVPPEGQGEGPGPGQVIADKFLIDRVIGVGGMGLVVAAHHLQLPQRVAIKFMRAQAARDPNAVERFLREARAAAALSSEHVTKVFDVGTLPAGEPYLVMELLDGVDLSRALEQHGPMPVDVAVGYVLQACEAIAEAHSLGIVHRDLKPANLFLNRRRDGSTLVKVLDFGISKVADFNSTTSANLTASGLVMGSPAYMSPEQIRSAKGVDARTDVWALGVILFELVTGRQPFSGETVGEMLAQILAETPTSVRQLRPETPARLEAVLVRCLERRLDRRIQNVGELAQALVPLGPAGGDALLERVLHWAGAALHHAPAPLDPNAPAFEAVSAAPTSANRTQTATPWLRTGSAVATASGRSRWSLVALVTGGAAVSLSLGAYWAVHRSAGPERPAVAPLAETAMARPPPTPGETASGAAVIPPDSTALAPPEDDAWDAAPPVAGAAPASPVMPTTKKWLKPSAGHPRRPAPTTPTSDEKDLY